ATESDHVLFGQTIEVLIDMLTVEDENASETKSPSDPLLAPPDAPTDDSENTTSSTSTTVDTGEGHTAVTTVERIFSPKSAPETSTDSPERSARRLTPPPPEDTPAPEPEPAFFAEPPPSPANKRDVASRQTPQSTWRTQKMEALRLPFTDDEDDEKTEVEP
ncbi:MAG: hypothetical protein KAI47_14125, partial [Deltaproteobacteria bacterium]|nr:hypothetical protein [Deltaproteobacteria bacterium]